MTGEAIAVLVGVIISVALEVVPGLKKIWTTWKWKPLSLLVLFVGLPLAAWALACFAGINFIPVPDSCGAEGMMRAFGVGFLAFLANQSTFALVTRGTVNAQARACAEEQEVKCC